MITAEQIREALHNVASDHDPEQAVKALLAEAFNDGIQATIKAGPRDVIVNPYEEPERKSPLHFPCTDCGAEPQRACRPLEGDHPRSIGYHDVRYLAAGWPLEDDA